jgi:hypothetical protein
MYRCSFSVFVFLFDFLMHLKDEPLVPKHVGSDGRLIVHYFKQQLDSSLDHLEYACSYFPDI